MRFSLGLAFATALVLTPATVSTSYSAGIGGLTALSARPKAPDFALRDIGGRVHRLSELHDKVVLINFWATWCPSCRAEMPSLQRLWSGLEDEEFVILAVNIGESKEQIAQFYFSIHPPLTFELLIDPDGEASQFWPLRGLPVTFLVDKRGRVTHVAHGARRWDTQQVVHTVMSLLREQTLGARVPFQVPRGQAQRSVTTTD